MNENYSKGIMKILEYAKKEAQRTLDTLMPYVEKGIPIVGLEPSCLLSFRDEFGGFLPGEDTCALAKQAVLFEEFLVAEHDAGRLKLNLRSLGKSKALVHGHCHQKAFGVMSTVEHVMSWIPGLDTELIESSCCGMAGAFGYDVENIEMSNRMGELSLLPKIRDANDECLIIADGTSCRHQITNGTNRRAEHVACILERALPKVEG